MARPSKATVDYFPHYTTHGKTMFVIESRFGNDGYAFWFKLLEILGNSEGHICDCKNSDSWEYLQAYTRLEEGLCMQILDKLAKLDAIDRELWEQDRVIWSTNFVANVKDAYKRRIEQLPTKPSLYIQKPSEKDIIADGKHKNEQGSDVSADINRESKVKESKVNQTKEDARARATDGLTVDISVDNLSPGEGNPSSEGEGLEETQGELSADENPDFMTFWNAYPRCSGMAKAMEAWTVLMSQGVNPKYVILAAEKYKAYVKKQQTAEQFIKMPHTFLGDGVYLAHLPKHLPECPRCGGKGVYYRDPEVNAVTICDCRELIGKVRENSA